MTTSKRTFREAKSECMATLWGVYWSILANFPGPIMRKNFRDSPNPNLLIRDGQTADMIISAGGAEAHLLPQSSLTLNNNGAIGVRTVVDGKVLFVPVEVLRDTIDGIWVLGLPAQVEVIVVGQEFVTDGVEVKVSYQEYGQ